MLPMGIIRRYLMFTKMKEISVEKNPDAYLLYEYMKKIAYTVRMKVTLDEGVDASLLNQAAQEAISRLPFFSLRPALDEWTLRSVWTPVPAR